MVCHICLISLTNCEPLFVLFSLVSCFFLSRASMSNYSPHHPVLRRRQSIFFPQGECQSPQRLQIPFLQFKFSVLGFAVFIYYYRYEMYYWQTSNNSREIALAYRPVIFSLRIQCIEKCFAYMKKNAVDGQCITGNINTTYIDSWIRKRGRPSHKFEGYH
jgi:hypothetical protein